MEFQSLSTKVKELIVNQDHMLNAIKYLSEQLENITKKVNSEKNDLEEQVKEMIEKTKVDKNEEVKIKLKGQEMIEELNDDIKVIKITKEENTLNTLAIKSLQAKIDIIDREVKKTIQGNEKENVKRNVNSVHDPVSRKCNLCQESFIRASDLEYHIKICHEINPEFKCDQCEKSFFLEWRLKKHINLHMDTNVKYCHYFNNSKKCPFEEMGCMFLHSTSDICTFGQTCRRKLCPRRHSKEKSDTEINDTTEDTIDRIAEESEESSNFITSTPKKNPYKCEECLNKTQCIDCYVREYTKTSISFFNPISGCSRP